MARQEGLEPPAYCLEGSCSIQLSYWRILTLPRRSHRIGAGDGNRTHVASLEGWNSTIELHPQSNQLNEYIMFSEICQGLFHAPVRLFYRTGDFCGLMTLHEDLLPIGGKGDAGDGVLVSADNRAGRPIFDLLLNEPAEISRSVFYRIRLFHQKVNQ